MSFLARLKFSKEAHLTKLKGKVSHNVSISHSKLFRNFLRPKPLRLHLQLLFRCLLVHKLLWILKADRKSVSKVQNYKQFSAVTKAGELLSRVKFPETWLTEKVAKTLRILPRLLVSHYGARMSFEFPSRWEKLFTLKVP